MNNILENPHCLGIRKLAGRSALIPAKRAGVYYGNKEDSELLQDLNGLYRFAYHREDELPDFFSPAFDDSDWDLLDVPSMWQYRGYGKPAYTNHFYPFPFDPPYINGENPVGYYRRHFELKKKTGRTILHFAGVDNAFFVYLNGEFAGFSKGRCTPAEFDVTEFVREGDNLLAVKVMTYSDASYLEAQDMLLVSGIFRDVFLLNLEEYSLWDYRVTSDLKAFTLKLSLLGVREGDLVRIELNGDCRTLPAAESLTEVFVIEEPQLWNAEDPYLYPLTIALLRDGETVEVHSKRIGMMHSEMRDWRFLVNGKPVYMKGINRHEASGDNGRALSRETMEREVRMIKACNLNAIRTSHYPDDPYFYELCSEIGLYVMDEADLETHGCQMTGDQGYLSKLPEWQEAYLDRVQRMLELDKNEACVYIHSMGNECGTGENMLAGQRLAAAFDPDHVAIHDMAVDPEKLYEGKPLGEGDNLLRIGYLSREKLEKVDRIMPVYMMIEYGHAMGNSPGFLRGYHEYMYSHPKYIGGFLWEFKSHGMTRKNADGTEDFLYGGDFGECCHWSNFCLDGFTRPDGVPKPSWNEVFEASAPIFITEAGEDFEFINSYDFRTTEGLLCRAELVEDTRVIGRWEGKLPMVEPHERGRLSVPLTVAAPVAGADYYLNLHFYDGERCIGNYQQALGVLKKGRKFAGTASGLSWEQQGRTVSVSGDGFALRFADGQLAAYEKNGVSYMDTPLSWNFMRAPIDNDGIQGMERWTERFVAVWREAALGAVRFFPKKTEVRELADRLRIVSEGRIMPPSRYYGFDAVMEYDIFGDGLILVKARALPYGNWPEVIPRIGLRMDMDERFRTLQWYGRGPQESYADSTAAAPVGRYGCEVPDSYFVYARPQDSGNHEDTAYLQLRRDDGRNLTVVGCPGFCFETHDYPMEDVLRSRHISDVHKDNKTHLYIDYRMRGLGSAACGPRPEGTFELSAHPFSFAFLLKADAAEEEALALHRADFDAASGVIEAEAGGASGTFSAEPGTLL